VLFRSVLKEARTLENVQVLYARALDTAIQHGCSLVFTSGETEFERRVCRKLGFVDAGSVIWYAQVRNGDHRADHDDQVEQPSFILR
jgi:hypothetical protein